MKNKLKEKTIRPSLKRSMAYLILGIWSLLILGILTWAVMTSLKTNSEIFTEPWDLPSSLNFDNYVKAWKICKMGTYFKNSILTVIPAVIANILLSSMAAYALTRFRFKLRKAILTYFVIGMSIPVQLIIVPQYNIMQNLHLTGNLWGLALVYVVISFSFNIFLLTGFFRSLPHEIEESAIIDGCGEFRLFFQIMFPLAQPGIITSAGLLFVSAWNEYLLALIYVGTKPELRTMALGMYNLRASMQYADYGGFFAAIVLMIVPSLLVFLSLQKYIMSGLTLGAVKG